jgi:hypothetical protein
MYLLLELFSLVTIHREMELTRKMNMAREMEMEEDGVSVSRIWLREDKDRYINKCTLE